MPFVQNDKKEVIENWFPYGRTWIQDSSKKCCHSALSLKAESQNPSIEDSWISEVEKHLLKNQSRGRIQTEVS